jgi:hypothetical protein
LFPDAPSLVYIPLKEDTMTRLDIMFAAFDDELKKIAGELQGHVRSGRRPIGVERLLARESESELTPTDVIEGGEEKEASAGGEAKKLLSPGKKAVALMATGAVGYHAASKANQDRKLGRQIRLQQGQ